MPPQSQWGASYAPGTPGANPAVGTQTAGTANVYVPDTYSKNAGQDVPGSGGTVPIPMTPERGITAPVDASGVGEVGVPGNPATMEQALIGLLQLGQDSPKALSVVQSQLVAAGYLNPKSEDFNAGQVNTGDATYDAFANLLNDSIVLKMPYTQILKTAMAAAKDKAAATTTKTETSTRITDAADAAGIADNESLDLLGRTASDKEAAAFEGQLDSAEEADPTTSTVTTGASGTNVTTTGGLGSEGVDALAQSNIIQNHGKEYAKVQGNQIYDLFESMLAGSGV